MEQGNGRRALPAFTDSFGNAENRSILSNGPDYFRISQSFRGSQQTWAMQTAISSEAHFTSVENSQMWSVASVKITIDDPL
jgi:hypothetical protein